MAKIRGEDLGALKVFFLGNARHANFPPEKQRHKRRHRV